MRWKLSEFLERHALNANQVAVRAGLSPNTVYPMARGEARRVDLYTLERIIFALGSLTGEKIDLNDLLELDDKTPEPAAWEKLVGIYDVPGSPLDGAINHDKYIGEALAEEHLAIVQQLASRLDKVS